MANYKGRIIKLDISESSEIKRRYSYEPYTEEVFLRYNNRRLEIIEGELKLEGREYRLVPERPSSPSNYIGPIIQKSSYDSWTNRTTFHYEPYSKKRHNIISEYTAAIRIINGELEKDNRDNSWILVKSTQKRKHIMNRFNEIARDSCSSRMDEAFFDDDLEYLMELGYDNDDLERHYNNIQRGCDEDGFEV